VQFATKKHLSPFVKFLWTSHDTPTCYLPSHCPLYLGISSVTKLYLHSYHHLYCDYSDWVVTLCVLELVQLADKYLWNSHDTFTCYLLSHCQFEHSVYLAPSWVTKRCLHSYQQLHCDYSAWVVTLSVLELVQLAVMLRFIVVCYVKYIIYFELACETSIPWCSEIVRNFPILNGSKLLIASDRLFLLPQPLLVIIYINLVIKLRISLCRCSHWLFFSSTYLCFREEKVYHLELSCLH
jgi:hypothetical protein